MVVRAVWRPHNIVTVQGLLRTVDGVFVEHTQLVITLILLCEEPPDLKMWPLGMIGHITEILHKTFRSDSKPVYIVCLWSDKHTTVFFIVF